MANEKRLIDAKPLMENGWHLVKTGESNKFLASMSLADVPTVDAVEVAEYDAVVYKLECLLCHATGGKYSKAGYSWEDMERMVTDYIEECCEEAVAEVVVHGYWIDSTSVDHLGRIVGHSIDCSVCDSVFKDDSREVVKRWKERFKVCPFCGAKMDAKE